MESVDKSAKWRVNEQCWQQYCQRFRFCLQEWTTVHDCEWTRKQRDREGKPAEDDEALHMKLEIWLGSEGPQIILTIIYFSLYEIYIVTRRSMIFLYTP